MPAFGSESVAEAEVHLVVIRADGSTEDLGTHYWSPSWRKRLMYKLRGWKN